MVRGLIFPWQCFGSSSNWKPIHPEIIYVLFPLGLLGHDDWIQFQNIGIDSQMVVRLGDEKTMVQIP